MSALYEMFQWCHDYFEQLKKQRDPQTIVYVGDEWRTTSPRQQRARLAAAFAKARGDLK